MDNRTKCVNPDVINAFETLFGTINAIIHSQVPFHSTPYEVPCPCQQQKSTCHVNTECKKTSACMRRPPIEKPLVSNECQNQCSSKCYSEPDLKNISAKRSHVSCDCNEPMDTSVLGLSQSSRNAVDNVRCQTKQILEEDKIDYQKFESLLLFIKHYNLFVEPEVYDCVIQLYSKITTPPSNFYDILLPMRCNTEAILENIKEYGADFIIFDLLKRAKKLELAVEQNLIFINNSWANQWRALLCDWITTFQAHDCLLVKCQQRYLLLKAYKSLKKNLIVVNQMAPPNICH